MKQVQGLVVHSAFPCTRFDEQCLMIRLMMRMNNNNSNSSSSVWYNERERRDKKSVYDATTIDASFDDLLTGRHTRSS